MKKLLLVLAILSISLEISAIDRISFDNLTGQTLSGKWNTTEDLYVGPSFRTVNFGTEVVNFQLSLTSGSCNYSTGLIVPNRDRYNISLDGQNCDQNPCACQLVLN